MRYALIALAVLLTLAQPLSAFADDTTLTTTTTTDNDHSAVGEIVLFPVRLVGGAVGAPIGAVAGLFTGFVKGFNFVGGDGNEQSTVTTTKHVDTDSDSGD